MAGRVPPTGIVDGPVGAINEHVAALPLVDHHVHSVLRGQLTPETLLGLLTESDRADAAAAAGMDTQLGIAVRRWTAPVLGLEAGLSAEAWLDARSRWDNLDAARRLLPSAGTTTLLVDTGFRAGELVGIAELAGIAGAEVREVVRIESVAERVARERPEAGDFATRFRDALHAAAHEAVGLKTIVAYRHGLDFDPDPPAQREVVEHAGSWLASIDAGGPIRLTDPVLLRSGIWEAVALGKPLQVHAGYGDTDLDLHRSDPLLLTGFLRRTVERCPVMLLHNYPFVRHAGYLAQVFPHVHLDVGLAVHHAGAASDRIVAESLELAPLRKVLFSSDGWGLPELHWLGSWLFRRGMARAIGRWVADGDWSADDARRVIELVGRDNARRVYQLTDG
jgi:predicted TIM-barrel fold metal-dependent hydrolase